MLIETRGNDGVSPKIASFHNALLNPRASFNGLWSLESVPKLDINALIDKAKSPSGLSYNDLAKAVFAALGAESELLDSALESYKSFDNTESPLEYEQSEENIFIQKLYTGPTRAFKDMAMQPFGAMLCALAKSSGKNYLILTATSGDTGPATLHAIKDKENIRCICLYPHNATSDVQRRQMTTINAENIKVIALKGDFDGTQRILKNLLNDTEFREFLDKSGFELSATNSVNFGRIIFQIIYHIHSYIHLLQSGAIKRDEKINIIVPSGNFGNALGAFFAKKMGVGIEKIIIATNANNVLYELITQGVYDIKDRKLLHTASPAMDILKSSNVERVLFHLFGAKRTRELMESLDSNAKYTLNYDELEVLRADFGAFCFNDNEVFAMIREYAERGIIIDPHTANGILAAKKYESSLKCVVCATAEWSKFAPTILGALEDCHNAPQGEKIESNDLNALDSISKRFKLPIHKNISDLFNKNEVNNEILDSASVKSAIISWLKQN